MATRISTGQWIAAATLLAALAAGGVVWKSLPPNRKEEPKVAALPVRSFPISPLSPTPYLNTGSNAQYVGSAACERCHPDTHQSYQETAMSRSMAEVDLSREPADGEFDHPRSGRRYKIFRQGGELWQRESLTEVRDLGEVVLAEYPVKYVVGSGHFSYTYLSEVEGFLVEAPATWFASKKGWDVSPGYDQPFPDGFERAATENCLYCHAGRAETLEGTLSKTKFHELAIGCERCHGPGSLHIDRWKEVEQPVRRSAGDEKQIDYTIVNPADLPRDRAEAVCQQCHLTSSAQVVARGRKLSDYRPGLPLHDFFMSFQLKNPESNMTVVGHVEQLARSACYLESETLTCLTCHNPHDKPREDERTDYYRTICLKCHQSESCRVDPALRAAQSADNDCVKCHMPGTATEIVHLAFTHHRIGIHRPEEASEHQPVPHSLELEPWHDLSGLSEIDFQRALGLAYIDRGFEPGPHSDHCFDQALKLLEEVYAAGLREGNVTAAMTHLLSRTHDPAIATLADEALQDPQTASAPRIRVLYALAGEQYHHGQNTEALAALTELTRLRRSSTDWAFLGFCQLAERDLTTGIASFEKALAINPKNLPLHKRLAQFYETIGETEKAERQKRIGERLGLIMRRNTPQLAAPTTGEAPPSGRSP
ncbi:MAG: multiheme c-type cytochrome [Planctomycetales bacterium]